MKSLFYNLFILLRNVTVLLLFLALTFLLLESIKYYQKVEKENSEVKALIAVDDYAIPVASQDVSEEEEFFDTIANGVEVLMSVDEAKSSDIIIVEEDNSIDKYILPEPVQEVKSETELLDKKGIAVDDDGSYNLYEEDLPQNIIIESGIHKDIKDIKIEPSPKPPYFGEVPLIAIVIDDMGINKKRTKDINSLQFPLTSSFLTYSDDLDGQIGGSVNSGHEVIAHIPMEAKSKINVAPDVLTVSMSDEEVMSRLNKMISKFDAIKGINNHMGSKFTEDKQKMYDVMEVLKEHNLYFLDSRTSNKSAGKEAAGKFMVSYANRNIFLDNENDLSYIMGQLRATEKVAVKKGYAIAIGHPKSQTYAALKLWLPSVEEKGFKLVHLSEIISILNKNK